MGKLLRFTFFLIGLAFISTSILYAQTITLSPTNPTVVLGRTIQITARVTGLSSPTVTWSVEGVAGGNATVGTISTAGLYRAPTTIPSNAPLITATSTLNTGISGSAYAYLLTAGPAITSVSPSPVAVGNLTVTVHGIALQPGAQVYVSYNSNNNIQMSTTAVTSTTITAVGYMGDALTASFRVKNPGSDYSNAINVPVTGGTPPPPTYTLTVVSGTGSGKYPAGKSIWISAGAPPTGQTFLNWTGAGVANANAPRTTLIMPAENTTVTANYSSAARYKLTVISGTGSGLYIAGQVVTITANAPPTGKSFLNWTGAGVANATASPTTITMPAAAATVTANYGVGPTHYTLAVVNGSGGGSYIAGAVVTISANTPPNGQVFSGWTGAAVANASASTTTLTMPAANTSVTANYSAAATTYSLTVVNGIGGGSYAAGTTVPITANAPPAGQVFINWTGASVLDANASSTILTMPASNTTVTANFAVPAPVPYPVSTHPRLWITPTDLTRLQGWAYSGNPIYAQGMQPLLAQAVSIYNQYFFPGGIAANPYPDPGDSQGYGGLPSFNGPFLTSNSEQYAVVLAFGSLIDPSAANRMTDAKDARNLLMYAMNQAALGHLANAPFRDPMFAVYNHANATGEQWPLIVDWIYNAKDAQGNAILTASDKATIRNVFMIWADDCLHASTTGGDHPSPIGAINSTQLLPGNKAYRMASNNYYLGHARLLTMMALCIDPADDPPVAPALPGSVLGNSLRSYIPDATGAWLYQEFAMMGDPQTVTAAYGLPGNGAGFGLASGGLPPEGMLYGHSFGFLLGQLLALQTAGFNNTALAGPQAALIGAPVWDRFVQGYLASLVPAAQVNPAQSYLGPIFEYASYGDLLRLWVTPDMMQPYTLLALLDQENGKTTNMDAARWFSVNATEGGAPALLTRITDPWTYGSTSPLLYYMLLDPTAAAATDPRPAFPATFFDPAAGRVVSHSDWTANATLFDYRASWISINHQVGDGGQFELYRNGEWLTKEMSNYDNNAQGLTTVYHNTLALRNWCANGTPTNLQWYETGMWANGSQWMEGLNAGDPTTVSSSGPGYVYASSNLTNLFNRPSLYTPANAAIDIQQATRSILWLNNDYIVVYDRATSQHSGLFKRFNLSLVTSPVINGNTATETLASGQKLFVQTLLPANPSLTSVYAAGNLNPIAQLEPTRYIFTDEDLTQPTDTRFLHVLQGADSSTAMTTATYVQSTGGTPFDGTVFGASAVYFPVSATMAFAGTTLSVPTSVHTMLVTGLTPNAGYGVGIQTGGTGTVVSLTTGGNGGIADGAGVLRVTF